jgi:hypothetical protein
MAHPFFSKILYNLEAAKLLKLRFGMKACVTPPINCYVYLFVYGMNPALMPKKYSLYASLINSWNFTCALILVNASIKTDSLSGIMPDTRLVGAS